ncbi:MAG: ribosome maturation factor RimM [Desulfuromonadaceae bacterium]|nr:ribosome maturation factor RimM [Desulfuromonas sp.]MDY0184501.1 ribosome maturation factor RimM [Desulfuromonadaceae bacterium]
MDAEKPTAETDGDSFLAGLITSTHSLKGEVKIRPEQAAVAALCDASEYQLRFAHDPGITVKVRRASPHKQLILAAFAGYGHIDRVSGFIGAEVWIDPSMLPEVTDGNYYWHQLQGLDVVDHALGALGTLDDMLTTPAHDIYIVQGPYGEVMIPVVPALVQNVDWSAGILHVTLPQGLVEIN